MAGYGSIGAGALRQGQPAAQVNRKIKQAVISASQAMRDLQTTLRDSPYPDLQQLGTQLASLQQKINGAVGQLAG